MKTKAWKLVRETKLSREAGVRVARRAQAQMRELTLRELRQGLALTQVQVAQAADMTQSELSRIESRTDHRISTLRRYIEALGGELEISFVLGKKRIKLSDLG